LAKKIKAGADFIQTQCIYDMDRFEEWMSQVRERGLHEQAYIMAGLTPLKSVRMAEYMRDNVAGLNVPDSIIDRLKNAKDAGAEGQAIAVEQIKRVQEIPGVAGVHIMAIGAERTVCELVEQAGLLPRPGATTNN